jgi:transcriptional regulator with XRE-family HTH domain
MRQERVELIDRHVGGRIRKRRIDLGLSQSELGQALGVSFQQVQKYEQGANRLGAGALFETAMLLGVPVGFFYEGLAPLVAAGGFAEADQADYDAQSAQADGAQLERAFGRIDAASTRKMVVDLVELLAAGEAAARR